MAFYLRVCFYMVGKITSLYWRLIGYKQHIKQCLAMVRLVIFEYVKLGYIWMNKLMFSKPLIVCGLLCAFWYVLHRRKIVPYGILVVGVSTRY